MERAKKILVNELKETLEYIDENDLDSTDIEILLRRWRYPYYEKELDYRLRRIESILEDQQESRDRRCPLMQEDNSGLQYLITGLEDKFKEEKRNIFSWLASSKSLIICDPYFYSFDKPKKHFRIINNYMEFQKELIPNGLKQLDVFHFEGPNRKIVNGFSNFCDKRQIKLRNYATGTIHDRVLIKDNDKAKMLGTSFGGLGNKIAFFVDLPKQDVILFKRELHKIRNEI